MDETEYIDIIEGWFDYLKRSKEKSIILQQAAQLAREGHREAAHQLKSQVDSQPHVYDGARLEEAVRALLDRHVNIMNNFDKLLEDNIKTNDRIYHVTKRKEYYKRCDDMMTIRADWLIERAKASDVMEYHRLVAENEL